MNKVLRIAKSTIRAAAVAMATAAVSSSLVVADDVTHRISMTMKDADLADVMDMISREQRVNVFVSTDSDEKVSFNLYDMALPDAIRAIANAAGFAVEYYDGNYFVVDRDEAGKYAPDAITTVRVHELQHVLAEDIVPLLQPYLSEYGEISVLEPRNLFLVEDTPKFQARVSALLRSVDKPPTQILIEARILEVTLTDEDSYGLDWTKIFSSDGGSGTFGTQGLTDTTSAGLFLDYSTPDVTAALNALTLQGRVRTLSSPKLLVVENQESSVIIGDRRGYSVTTTINQVTSESIEFLESGVILRVKASVDNEHRIALEIHPEVSTGTIDPTTGIPSQTTTEVTTRMIVDDGTTVFVGGLIKNRIDESKVGVPVLGRIPVVGRLFSNRQKTLLNTETIVLIRPSIVEGGADIPNVGGLDQVERLELDQREKMGELDAEMELFFGQ